MEAAGITATRVLFVDDEQMVLEGLRRMMRMMGDAWACSFASSGGEALALVERDPIDVLVTDMRMPGMDGAELLERVQRLRPSTARIALSGHVGPDAAMRAATVAHQFLDKPCSSAVLRATLERVRRITGTVESPELRALIGSLRSLPARPRMVFELSQAISDGWTSYEQIAALLERDPALATKALQLANAAYFSGPGQVRALPTAIARLGLGTLRAVVLAAGVLVAATEGKDDPELARVARHSLATGKLLAAIFDDPHRRDDALVCGIVHDVGTLVLLRDRAADVSRVRARVAAGEDADTVERDVFGATHAALGAYLLGLWGLPEDVAAAVAQHSKPGPGSDAMTRLLHVAERLVDEVSPTRLHEHATPLDAEGLDALGVEMDLESLRSARDAAVEASLG